MIKIVFLFLLDFFRKKGVCTLTVKELFDFVTDITINEDNIDHYLEEAMTLTSTRSHDEVTDQQKIDEQVNYLYKQRSYIKFTENI